MTLDPIKESDRRVAARLGEKHYPRRDQPQEKQRMMVNAKHIDGVKASTVALRAGKFRDAATRITGSIGDTALVVMALLWHCSSRRSRRFRPGK